MSNEEENLEKQGMSSKEQNKSINKTMLEQWLKKKMKHKKK